ncbi:LytTR family transcriptional regulator DNA-binding domain-containing protein [Fibrella sp. USSR17]
MQFISEILEQPVLLAYFIGADNYTWLHFRDGEQRLLAKPLTYFEQRLPAFVRVHKTALVNPDCVASVSPPPRPKLNGTVRMRDGMEMAISRRRWAEVAPRLQPINSEPVEVEALPTPVPVDQTFTPYHAPTLVILAVMTGDTLLLTRDCLATLNVPSLFQPAESGAELANSLTLGYVKDLPALIILDARTKRPDRMLALRALKSRSRLRAIPVVWLTNPGDDTSAVYELDANSVVVIPDDSASLIRIMHRLCQYWLTVAQLPPGVSLT